MFKYLLRGVLSAIALKMVSNYGHLSCDLVRLEAAKAYLQIVRTARLSAIGLMRMELVIALLSVGVLLLHVSLFMLLPWSLQAKATLALILGLAYVGAGWAALRAAMAEKPWLELTGAAEFVACATRSTGNR